MTRIQSKIVLEHIDKNSYKHDQIIEAVGIWAIFYEDHPINLKTSHYLNTDIPSKYKKTSFSNPGHARNLCRKLNTQFKTDKFSVHFLSHGRQVYPDDTSDQE